MLYLGQQANQQMGFSEEDFFMEMEGIVSVWAGVFETDKALKEYFDDMPGRDIPPFSRDFFDGCDIYPFDTDFSERSVHEFTLDPEALVCHYSEGTVIGPELKKLFPQGFEKPYNQELEEMYNDLLSTEGLYHMNMVAKELKIGRNTMLSYLRGKGIMFYQDNSNVPYQRFMNQKLFAVIETTCADGKYRPVTYATKKGLDYIRKLLRKDGYYDLATE